LLAIANMMLTGEVKREERLVHDQGEILCLDPGLTHHRHSAGNSELHRWLRSVDNEIWDIKTHPVEIQIENNQEIVNARGK